MADSLLTPRVPFCTIFLVVGTIVCNALVLLGNYWTAQAFVDIGDSTKGWSKVGLGISSALVQELDVKMYNVSSQLVVALEHVISVQNEMDNILSLVGNTTDSAISNSSVLSLLDTHGPEKGLMLLQETHGISNASNVSGLTTLITNAVSQALNAIFGKITYLLNLLIAKLKPSLMQIANWTSQFGATISHAVEEFGTTLDKAQKMFDQAMSQLGSHGYNVNTMIHNTFTIFDTTGSGYVSAANLIAVGHYYTVSAFAGSKPYELIHKYDKNGNGVVNKEEFGAMVQDPSITGSMAIILRNYAKRLAQIAGSVGKATMRDEVASSVADYVRLVGAKNLTKIGWIADALSNNSLNENFIGAVVVELCIKALDPNAPVYTQQDTGQLLTTKMYELNPYILVNMTELLSNTSWWTVQGLDTVYQPSCMMMLTNWTLLAHNATGNGTSLLQVLDGVSLDESVDQQKLLEAMPMAAYQLAEESVKLYKLEQMQERRAKMHRLFSTKTSQMLLQRLNQGAMASAPSGAGSNAAALAINGGQHAVPSTLLFAKWLSYNASNTAALFIKECTDYSGESSNQASGFNSEIKGMIAKVESFLSTFALYASPQGVKLIEYKFQNFTTNAIAQVQALVQTRLNALIYQYEPALEGSLHQAAYIAGEKIGTMIGSVLSAPITQALTVPVDQALAKAVGTGAAAQLSAELANSLGVEISNFTSVMIGKEAGSLLDKLITQGLNSGGQALSNTMMKLQPQVPGLSLAEQSARRMNRVELKHDLASISSLDDEIDRLFEQNNRRTFKAQTAALYQSQSESGVSLNLSTAWTDVYNLMTSLYNLVPQALTTLKEARREIGHLSHDLESIFAVFQVKGPQIFTTVAENWKLIWVVYFLFLMPFCAFTLYYGFWANGWFGGPQPIAEEDVAEEPPTGFFDRLKVLGSSCFHCCQGFHDTQTCFWSVIIFMQVMVLLTFLMSILLIIIAGVQAMMTAGCQTIYVIQDPISCTQGLHTVQSLLLTFGIGNNNTLTSATISEACASYSLLTCQMISTKLSKSAVYVSIFSFVASIFSLQMLFDSATLHEQAVARRKAATLRAKQD